MSTVRWWLVVVALALLGCGDYYDDKVPPDRLWVHYFNDWHGRLEPFERPGTERSVGGAARLYTLIQARRGAAIAAGADTLLIVAGDILQGTPLSTVFRGEPDFELLRRMRVDAMSLGNHEFDFGQPNLQARIAQAEFPMLAANVFGADGELLTAASTILELPESGRRVGIVGVVTADVPITTHSRNVQGLTFEDPVVAAARELPALVAECDYVIVLSHCGLVVDRRLAALEGVDLVVGGHDQQLVEPVEAGAPIVQAGEWGEHLGEAHLERLHSGRVRLAENRYLPVDARVPEDPETLAFVAHYRSLLGEELKEELAVTSVRLEGERSAVRTRETNLANLVTDAIRASTGTDVALLNGGAIRASIEPGVVTLEHVIEVLPFDNRLQRGELTGAEVYSLLERSFGLLEEGGDMGGFLQVSGLRVERSASGVLTIEAGGEPLVLDRNYRVVTTDFLALGGDGYEELIDHEWTDSGYTLADVLTAWLRDTDEVFAEVDGRLVRHPG